MLSSNQREREKHSKSMAVIVPQRSLQTPEIYSSSPVVGIFYFLPTILIRQNEIERGREWPISKGRPQWCTLLCKVCRLSLTFLTDGAQFKTLVTVSVTRLGDLLDFGRLFKDFGSN